MKIQISKYYILFVLVLAILLTGCKVRRPNNVIPENKMEELLYDYHIAKALGENLPYTENYKKALYVEYVFQKHETSEANFDSSMVWYTRHAEILSKIYERVNLKLKAEQAILDKTIAIRDNKPQISTPGDSIDVWLQERMVHLSKSPLNNKLDFIIPTDSNFKSRDTLQWNIHYHFLGIEPDSTKMALMSMAIQYENDSVISIANEIFTSGQQSLRIQSDTLGDIKEIRGFIYFTGKDSIKHLYADQISLMRYHSNDSLFSITTDTLNTEEIIPIKEELKPVEQNTEQQIQQQPERVNPDELRRKGERPRPMQKTEATKEKTSK